VTNSPLEMESELCINKQTAKMVKSRKAGEWERLVNKKAKKCWKMLEKHRKGVLT
jgi:hypothetical protein